MPGGDNSGQNQIFVYLKGNCKVQMYALSFLKAIFFSENGSFFQVNGTF